ncbi:uncharacterized protein LOC123531449 isoform X2 [Mercenaria mercenaria]|uniref:uncharacterized protein LOC123531449 isoform X2 n=1 Tax=Mercenaria mercenaria TaxID=6596 RepID=UPI00234F69EB|nr:uncharacterized protein LOC123531449 isoform X2 [Mercenaria mercenaria]
MPAFIAPIEHTRAAFLKHPDGLRFGNFEGVVHLPPVPVDRKQVSRSFSTLNNQQIYKTVCEWYEVWRPWQQKVLLCGIVDRCSVRQVDMLATTLEPIRHRDYTVAVKHHYPSTPLKHIQDKQGRKKKKKKVKKKTVRKEGNEYQRSLNVDGTLAGAVTPESVIDTNQEILASHDQKDFEDKLADGKTHQKKQLSTIPQEKTKEFTNVDDEFSDIDSYADSIAKRIIEESIPKTVQVFEPSELYAQDLASSIMQQAMAHVVDHMDEREKSIQSKIEKTRLPELESEQPGHIDGPKPNEKRKEEVPVTEAKDATAVVPLPKHHHSQSYKDNYTETTVTVAEEKPVDMSVLDKYRKFKPPKEGDKSNRFYKMEGRPKSLVRILIPDGNGENGEGESKRADSPRSMVSRSFSAVTHSTLSNLRYHLFGSRSLKTPDYFKKDGVASLEGGLQHLRSGIVRRPVGMHSLPVPISKMYKSVKWWTELPEDGKNLVPAQKQELGAYFKDQLEQVWKWMELWEDFEKIALLKELLKLCGPEDLNFLCGHLEQKLRNARDINRMSDKLLLYIFSFIPADEISRVKRVSRRWRYLCATDDLWMVKCHELGLAEGIKNLDKMIVKAKGYRMVIDWKMAYDEIKRITYNMKMGMKKKKVKPVQKGRTVEFKEQLELLKQKAECSSDSLFSETDLDTYDRPRFEFRNRIVPTHEIPRGSLTRDELHQMIKKMIFEPEEKQKQQAISRGTPVIVELEVHRGTVSAIRRLEKGEDDDAHSVLSEDLREFDDEYKLQWEKKAERKPGYSSQEPLRAVSTEGGVEILSKSEDRFDRIKRMQAGMTPRAGPSILRRRKEMADDAGGDDAAYDIRPDLVPADDILGKAKPHMSLEWRVESKKSPRDDEDEEEEERSRRRRQPVFVGEVRSVLRARKLQGHMSGITCVQFDQRRLISAGLDRVIRMWDIRSGRSLHKFFGHKGGIRCLQFIGNELATGSWDTTVMIWDLRNLSRRYILTDHTDSVTCLTMNQDFLISGSVDCTVRVWRRSSYLCCNVIRGHKQAVNSLAFDGTHVVSASKDRTLRLSNIVTGECVRTFDGADSEIVTVTMKGSLILSGDLAGRVFFWNKLSGECEAAIKAHPESVNRVVYREGRFFTASSDGTIREWDLVTMTSVRLLQGHKGPVKDLKVSGDRIVSCSDDGSIRIWDLFDPRKKTTEEEQIKQLHQECPTL